MGRSPVIAPRIDTICGVEPYGEMPGALPSWTGICVAITGKAVVETRVRTSAWQSQSL
jgi:hypothetical protein